MIAASCASGARGDTVGCIAPAGDGAIDMGWGGIPVAPGGGGTAAAIGYGGGPGMGAPDGGAVTDATAAAIGYGARTIALPGSGGTPPGSGGRQPSGSVL